MSHRSIRLLVCGLLVFAFPNFVRAQNQPASDPQALAYAAQSIAVLTGGNTISDVTLTGTVTWNGGGTDTGTATLRALGSGESRMDLALTGGTWTEIRDAQTGPSLGQWISQNNASGNFAAQNCWIDAVWFFPALGSLASGPNVVLSYIGQETRNGGIVQHVQSYVYVSGKFPNPTPQQLSTMDFYLDAATFLPVAISFNAHPDDDATSNLLIEVDFSSYQTINGSAVPTHIQKYQQGNLMVDAVLSGASFNTGLSFSIFVIN
jgi:hypothetical protein